MNIQRFFSRGTQINKIAFSDIESYLEEKGMNVNEAFALMADEREYVYVSAGFVRGLRGESEEGEWHHYFTKDADGDFVASKMKFC